jgi:HEAT repeat protein
MTCDEALAFLRDHQPMPCDRHLGVELIQQYDQVREYFLEHHDERCVPLFLNSFGEGSGLGVYPMVEDIVRAYPPSTVVPHLATALASEHEGTRYWCAQIAALFPTPALIQPLAALLADESPDTRFAAVTALERIEHEKVVPILRDALTKERDDEIRGLILEVLQNSGSQ